MKYFNPSYWFKLWVLSAPLFNDETIGINAKSIDNKKIKDWASKNTNLQSISQEISYTNSTTNTNYQLYNLNQQLPNQNIDPLYQIELETNTHHKHRHEKSRDRHKREKNGGSMIEFEGHFLGVDGKVLISLKPEFWEEISFLYFNNNQENFAEKFKDKMYTGVWKDWRVENVPEDIKKLGKVIYDNFSTINNKFRNSSRRERIMIIIEKNKDFWTSNYSFAYKEAKMITDDSHYYSNNYIPNLISDFKTCIDPVDNINDETILKAIKSKNPSLDTSQVYVKEKTINGKLDIGVKSDSNKYNINSSASCPNLQVKPNLISDFKTCIDPVDNINDETILKAIKSKNPSLDTSQVYVKEKTINGKLDIGVKSDSNKYNINSSAWCPNLQVKPNSDKFIKSLDSRISFLGSDMQERGVLWLDTLAKKIKFYPRTDDDGNQKTFGTYKNIIIKDQNDNTIKIITFNLNNTMSEVLNAHNLNSKKVLNDGLDYENGYSIEITSSQADTTWLKRNDDHDWRFNASKGQHTEKIFIINNWLWHKDYYLKKQRNEINLKRNLNLETTFFQNNFYCKENNILTNINKETILDKSKIILSSAIDNKNNVYISTDNGVYKINFEKNENWKIPGFNNDLISKIILDASDNPYFISVDGNAYFLTNHWFWWNSVQRIDKYHNVPEIKNVLEIKSIITNKKINDNGVYFATNHGVFYMKSFSWTANKIGGIDEIIVKISIDTSGNAYFISVDGNAYYITNTLTWTAERIDIKHNVPEIKNVLSINEIPNTSIVSTADGVYFATNHGVFYMKSFSWTANKIGGIDEIIAQIAIDKNGNAYFISVDGNAYYFANSWFWWSAVKIDDYYNVPEIKNVLSIKTDNNNVYYTTDHGVYIIPINNWTQIKKIGEINKIITEITTSNNNLDCFKSFSFSKSISTIQTRQNNLPTIVVDDDEQEINEQRLLSAGIGDAVNGMSQGFLNFVNSFYGTNEIRGIQDYLINEGIITPRTQALWTRNIPYQLNNQRGYFIVNVDIRQQSADTRNRRLQLVFNRNDFYLQGFIVRNGNSYTSPGTYYYFRDALYQNLEQNGISSTTLRISGSYTESTGLNADQINPSINWNSIISSFNRLISYNGNEIDNNLINALTTIIFSTSESWRFHHLFPRIAETSINYNQFRWNEYGDTLRSWGSRSGSRNLTPLDISRFNFPLTNNYEQYFDFRHLNWILFSSIRIVLPSTRKQNQLINLQSTTPRIQTNTSSSGQGQNSDLSKSGYTLEQLRNKKYNTDFQQAQINYQSNQNLNDYTNAQQRFVQAQNDYVLHIQQGQPLPTSRGKRDVFTVENKFDENIVKSINQEQHLPITNNSYYVANNITNEAF